MIDAVMLAGGAGLIAGLLVHVDPSLVQSLLARNNVRLSSATPSTGAVIAITSLLCFVVASTGCVGSLCNLPAVLVLVGGASLFG
ncbi:hypothetical protein ACOMHN_063253 [Nucella lapillus]